MNPRRSPETSSTTASFPASPQLVLLAERAVTTSAYSPAPSAVAIASAAFAFTYRQPGSAASACAVVRDPVELATQRARGVHLLRLVLAALDELAIFREERTRDAIQARRVVHDAIRRGPQHEIDGVDQLAEPEIAPALPAELDDRA